MKTIDLVLFMGQSNMAGRGNAQEAPAVPSGYGYEFRAVSDSSMLYDITEPFGVNENKINGIDEPHMKTGSLVSAFVNAYYEATSIPIVGVSASKGGSSINEWQPGGNYLTDAIERLNAAKEFLLQNNYQIRKTFMVWCQGETDGDNAMPEAEYKTKLKAMLDTMLQTHVEICFLIRIGNHRDDSQKYVPIQNAQTDFCNSYKKAVLVSTKFDTMAALHMMKDPFHYKQDAYNTVGQEAGENTASYLIKMYDN
ncbi:sialate O-acetylesterase [Konateibacter massiliensis]|uniref:sialate O-acetylesterase n=1 Tax=Konateibacter massiliensis TaxID=2002841 RepID=UPI000C156BFD|nr:sialate O-acetylesterase [Konateibacter massiliensis]